MAGMIGTWGRERGLTFYEVDLGGHELPRYSHSRRDSATTLDILTPILRYAPGPSFRAMELLLGRISSLGDVGGFTTQTPGTIDISGPT